MQQLHFVIARLIGHSRSSVVELPVVKDDMITFDLTRYLGRLIRTYRVGQKSKPISKVTFNTKILENSPASGA